ncbi:MAG TPA: exonuclease domain-containing protein [Candidatus Izemoplasmatales bacterium]|nr:exonuclease domain-containing protein [Candidatus Izemoplasmatales bacterium]
MATMIAGPLYDVFPEIRVISVKSRRRTEFFYMPKGMFLTFMQYFSRGIYVFMTVSESMRRYKGVMVRSVENIEKILYPDGQNPRVFFDINLIQSGIKTLLNADRNRLFIDFEMSMPPFRNYQNFVSEIIQCGMVLTDAQGTVLERVSTFIKPLLFPLLSDRTQKFLHIKQAAIDSGLDYPDFYRMLDGLVRKYRPMIFVWGQNDMIELKKSTETHDLPDITRRLQVIDLLKLHKNYFALKNDLGLFNAYRLYYTEVPLEKQAHDAFEDASVTHEVFEGFRKVCNGEKTVILPSEKGTEPTETVQA